MRIKFRHFVSQIGDRRTISHLQVETVSCVESKEVVLSIQSIKLDVKARKCLKISVEGEKFWFGEARKKLDGC